MLATRKCVSRRARRSLCLSCASRPRPRSRLLKRVGPLNAFASGEIGVGIDRQGVVVAANDNGDAPLAATFSQVGAWLLAAGGKDAAVFVTLAAGATYTAQVSGADSTTVEALIEVCEVRCTGTTPTGGTLNRGGQSSLRDRVTQNGSG